MKFSATSWRKFNYGLLLIVILLFSCKREIHADFTPEALAQSIYNLEMQESSVGEVLAQNKGKKVIIYLWASWCADCIKSLPDVAEFQRQNPDIQFVMFSVDENQKEWQSGIARYMDKHNIQGDQYFFNTGWEKDSDNFFIDFVGLDWIPRYMLLNEDGNIDVFYAKKINDKAIKEKL